MKNRKGIDRDGRRAGEVLGELEGGGNIIRIYYVAGKKSVSRGKKGNKREKELELLGCADF